MSGAPWGRGGKGEENSKRERIRRNESKIRRAVHPAETSAGHHRNCGEGGPGRGLSPKDTYSQNEHGFEKIDEESSHPHETTL